MKTKCCLKFYLTTTAANLNKTTQYCFSDRLSYSDTNYSNNLKSKFLKTTKQLKVSPET